MKNHKTRNAVLALTGLAALSLYILACTSFSPDDTKVLYPAFDADTGLVGTAVYDRDSGRSEMLFLSTGYTGSESNTPTPPLMRAQWLGDGRRILIAWSAEAEGGGLSLALMPWPGRTPVKLFHLPNTKDATACLVSPLCVPGDRAFVMRGDKELVRLDLKTGALVRHEFTEAEGDITLYPAPADDGVLYVENKNQSDRGVIFGRLDPDSFTRTPLMTITNDIANGLFFAYDRQLERVAVVETNCVVVLRKGVPIFTRSLGGKDGEWTFGNGVFSPQGDVLYAGFMKKTAGQHGISCGLLEIPLSTAPIRQTTLVSDNELAGEGNPLFFQIGLSHDGKTVAVASTYLACDNKQFKAGDCALFLVDLKDPARKVTKVPIPLPANRLSPAAK